MRQWMNEPEIERTKERWSRRQGWFLVLLGFAVVAFVIVPVCVWPDSNPLIRLSTIAILIIVASLYLNWSNKVTRKEIRSALEPGESYEWFNNGGRAGFKTTEMIIRREE
jgi:hypothetical protein